MGSDADNLKAVAEAVTPHADAGAVDTDPAISAPDVVCFGGEDWWYHNRGHIDMQLMRRFARQGTVLYVNSIVMQKPNFKKGIGGGRSLAQKVRRKLGSILKGLQKSDAGFWVYSPFSLPLHHIPLGRKLNKALLGVQMQRVRRRVAMQNPIIWVACPVACDVAIDMSRRALIYQRTDRFEEYPNIDPDAVRRCDQTLKKQADLTVFVNETLYREESDQCRRALYLDHGVDYDLFASAQSDAMIPDALKRVPRPIAGFFGGIDSHTSDLPFMEQVVDLLPDVSFVFVGRASTDIAVLEAKPNVWMLGQKPYEQVPHYGKSFDLCFMSWHRNEWITMCNPIKLKEYLALGKPVVSTPFDELEKYLDVVYKAGTPLEFAACIRQALEEDTPAKTRQRRVRVQQASWESKAQRVLEELSHSHRSER